MIPMASRANRLGRLFSLRDRLKTIAEQAIFWRTKVDVAQRCGLAANLQAVAIAPIARQAERNVTKCQKLIEGFDNEDATIVESEVDELEGAADEHEKLLRSNFT